MTRHNRMERITLIGIVLGGRFPMGHLSWRSIIVGENCTGAIIWGGIFLGGKYTGGGGQSSGGNFLRDSCLGGNILGVDCLGVIVCGAVVLGAIIWGAFVQGELSCSHKKHYNKLPSKIWNKNEKNNKYIDSVS